MSDTPETDSSKRLMNGYADEWVPRYISEELERKLTEVTKQRDALIEGLEKLASCDWVITLPDRMDAVREIANEALNKLKS